MKEEKASTAKTAKETECLTRQLVLDYIDHNGGHNFLNEPVTNTTSSDDVFKRLEARLEMESKFSHQGEYNLFAEFVRTQSARADDEFLFMKTDPKKSLLERIVQSYLGMTSNLLSVSKKGLNKENDKNKNNDSKIKRSPKEVKSKQLAMSATIESMPQNSPQRQSLRNSPYTERQNHRHSKFRPVTATPNPKRRFTRPSTASPNFHRQRIKVHAPHSDGKPRSKESWIPEEIRQKMLKRELSVAMVNFEAKETCNMSMKHITRENGDSLERSLSKEKFGIEQRKPCGLCCMKFLPVNLVLAVPLKAVLDIRNSWGDKFDPEGSRSIRVNPNLRKAPACYNSTRVCAFCAQLFDQQQDTYRPSFEAKEAEKERLRDLELEAQRKIENDPLSQIEKERDAEVTELNKVVSREKKSREKDIDEISVRRHSTQGKLRLPISRL